MQYERNPVFFLKNALSDLVTQVSWVYLLLETHRVDKVREGEVEPGVREHVDLLHLLHVLS